jgi:hypothetical protein
MVLSRYALHHKNENKYGVLINELKIIEGKKPGGIITRRHLLEIGPF